MKAWMQTSMPGLLHSNHQFNHRHFQRPGDCYGAGPLTMPERQRDDLCLWPNLSGGADLSHQSNSMNMSRDGLNQLHPSLGNGYRGGLGLQNMLGTSVSMANSPLVIPQPMKPMKIGRTYQCKMCDQVFNMKSDMLIHSQQVHKQDPKPYKCHTCSKSFANSSYLSQHGRIHAGIKPYQCTTCERKFTQLSHLQQHIRTHTGEKPYQCKHPGCGKAFSQLSNLQSHSRSHMTDRPYRCNSCYKCFADEIGLRDHIPKHSETKHLKTQICLVCGKAYTQETYLNRHMAKHAAENLPKVQQRPGMSSMSIKQEPLMGSDDFTMRGLDSGMKTASAFMPITSQYGMINQMSSPSLPCTTYRHPLPPSGLGSSLPHISSMSMSQQYFPYDPIGFHHTKPTNMQDRNMNSHTTSRVLPLEQIKHYSQQMSSYSTSCSNNNNNIT